MSFELYNSSKTQHIYDTDVKKLIQVDRYDRPIQEEHNVVVDFNKLQGVAHPADLFYIPRSLNSRYITVENGSCKYVSIVIDTNVNQTNEVKNEMMFTLRPLETKFLGINASGEQAQFIHIYNPQTKKLIGDPEILGRDTNSFVIREGINKYWIQRFSRPGYRYGW